MCVIPVEMGVLYFHRCSVGSKGRRSPRQKIQDQSRSPSLASLFLVQYFIRIINLPIYFVQEEKLFYQGKGKGVGRSSIWLTYAGVSQAAGTEMSQGFLKIIDDNFLTQKVFHPTQRNSVLYLILTDKEDLITELKISGSQVQMNMT